MGDRASLKDILKIQTEFLKFDLLILISALMKELLCKYLQFCSISLPDKNLKNWPRTFWFEDEKKIVS